MLRFLFIIVGLLMISFLHFVSTVQYEVQFVIFITGIILLGIPHGAADMLVATMDAQQKKYSFSPYKFLLSYLFKLSLFAALLWFMPLAGNLLFMVFAAYHFGETDLHNFNTGTIAGKLFTTSYGLLILGVIILHHFEEVMPMFALFNAGVIHADFINYISNFRYQILSVLGVLFFACTFYYFAVSKNVYDPGQFLIQFAILLFLLFNMPVLLGFTFYFVMWHSVFSLKNIVSYLKKGRSITSATIIKQIGFYSFLALAGTAIFGAAGFMFTKTNAVVVYVFLALAVLTAPHMQIMHSMYNNMRKYGMQ